MTPGNRYKVYKANDAFIYLLGRLSEKGGAGSGWSKDEAIDKWSEYIHDKEAICGPSTVSSWRLLPI